jgi:hypothetical protein
VNDIIAKNQSAYGNDNAEHMGSGNVFVQFHFSAYVVVQNITSYGKGWIIHPLKSTISSVTPALPAGNGTTSMLKPMQRLPGAATTRLLKERPCKQIFSF